MEVQSELSSVKIETKQNTGKFGYTDELTEMAEKRKIPKEKPDLPGYSTMHSKSTRDERISGYYKNLDEKMGTLALERTGLRESMKHVDTTNSLFAEEVEYTKNINDYTQVGLISNARELSYEHKMAEKNAQKNNTKDNRKRKEKRDKLMEKHQNAVVTAGDAAYNIYKYGMKFENEEIGKYERMALREATKPSLTAKKELVKVLKDVEKHEISTNIKMAHIGKNKKRAIDMGDGTTKFFQKLAEIRADYKVLQYDSMISMDHSSFSSYIPEKEKKRYNKKTKKLNEGLQEKGDKLKAELNSIAKRIPDLICALNKDKDKQALKDQVDKFIASEDMEKKIEFIDKIMSNPDIMACIRKDMRGSAIPTDFSNAASEIEAGFLDIVGGEMEQNLENMGGGEDF